LSGAIPVARKNTKWRKYGPWCFLMDLISYRISKSKLFAEKVSSCFLVRNEKVIQEWDKKPKIKKSG
jgi:hypothetical protein